MDAVNPQWHLTSATPYDPPLTYGGWKQAQALGARIGNILHLREAASNQNAPLHQKLSAATREEALTEGDGQRAPDVLQVKRRRQRLVIHTSPFLRCIETAIGISAGLEQYRGSQESRSSSTSENPHSRHQSMQARSSYLRTRERRNSSHLSAIPEPDEIDAARPAEPGAHSEHLPKARLRLDAFLGEWLSPEYFEMITPPPDSKMMIASAKAALFRLKQPETFTNGAGLSLGRGNFPGGWGSDRAIVNGSVKSFEDESFGDVTELSHGLPGSNPSNGQSDSGHLQNPNFRQEAGSQNLLPLNHGGYMPLQPAFAVSSLGEIPAGFIAHARDACLDIDYRWDSMWPPQNWGDGGVLGEQWSSMHQRFRRGLQNLITWYRDCRTIEINAHTNGEAVSDDRVHYENDEEIDPIVVLVTHGAGCNALIGALTNQPVLLDVGMASLTMAVRKAPAEPPRMSSDTKSAAMKRSITGLEISQDYEMKMIASTDHLCAPRHSSSTSRFYRSSPTPRTYTLFSRPHSGSVGSNISEAATMDVTFTKDDNTNPPPDPPTHNSTGLWTKPVVPIEQKEMFALQSDGPESSRPVPKITTTNGHENNHDAHQNGGAVGNYQQEQLSDSFAMQCGLWGSAPQALGTTREKGYKRRWTHSEISMP